MKRTITKIMMLALAGLSNVANAQAPNWVWAKGAGSTGDENGMSTTTDASGNVYLAGYYKSAAITFGTTTLTNANAGSEDIFLVKYDALGSVLWANGAGSTGYDVANSITTDASGNVIVAGGYNSPSITFGTTTLTAAGSTDMFIVKYDSSGNVLWANRGAGSGYDDVKSVAVDDSGNVVATGSFDGPNITFGTTTLTNANTVFSDIFVVKYDPIGNVLWAKKQDAGGNYYDVATSVAADASGNVYVTGFFDYPSVTFGAITLTNQGGVGPIFDMFLVKYDASGNVLWAKGAGGDQNDRGNSTTTDASGNVYVTGGYNSTDISFGGATLTNAGGSGYKFDMFLVKYDASGNVLWAKGAGGTGYDDFGNSTTTDASGNVYVTGVYTSPSITFGTTTLTNAGSTDMFIVKYDTSGNVLWAKGAGSSSIDNSSSITIDVSDNLYVAGTYNSPTITFGATTLTNAGGSDMFIAKLDTTVVTGNNEKENFGKGILLFPNPATNNLTLAFGSNDKIIEVTITDITGKIIYTTTESNTQKIEVNTKDFAEGVYVVQVQSAENLQTKKLIVTR